jgi:hypothetical protein
VREPYARTRTMNASWRRWWGRMPCTGFPIPEVLRTCRVLRIGMHPLAQSFRSGRGTAAWYLQPQGALTSGDLNVEKYKSCTQNPGSYHGHAFLCTAKSSVVSDEQMYINLTSRYIPMFSEILLGAPSHLLWHHSSSEILLGAPSHLLCHHQSSEILLGAPSHLS